MTKQLNPIIKKWLNNRGISDEIISQYEIGWNGEKIIIPIHDQNGKILFNKYRRDPNSEQGPKYKYDTGSKASLYGLKTFNKENKWIVICEGELDALCLLSHDIPALSSTGGSGTFLPEWADFLSGIQVFICYDFDDAGISGAFKVHSIIPNSHILWLPKEVGESGDITDFFIKLKKTRKDFLKLQGEKYKPIKEWRGLKLKKELFEIKKEYQMEMESLLISARELRSKYMSDRHIQVLLNEYQSKYDEINRSIKYWSSKPKKINENRLLVAKIVPIDQYIKFNRQGFANCVWHHDTHPSMFYYKEQNKVHCFSCNKNGDVLDVIKELNKVGLSEAIDIILGKNEKK